ncbi:MAG: PQQ-like beta-propeller repeat protein [Aureliella sp.]
MKPALHILIAILLAAASDTACSLATAQDWPQWMGPDRNGEAEAGLATEIPADGLPIIWSTPIGAGYSGPAVVGDHVYVTDYIRETGSLTNGPGTRDAITGEERTLCIDATNGSILWTHKYSRPYSLSFAAGPRATPTVDGDHLYVLGAEGDLTCLNRHTGKPVWHKFLPESFPSEEGPIWGHAAHPLVHGDMLFCLGSPDSVAVALNKNTGELVWKSLTASEIGYCPPTILKAKNGSEQLIVWHAESVNALEPNTGKPIWSVPLRPQYAMAIAAPVKNGNRLFVSGIGKTAAMLPLDETGQPGEPLWSGKTGAGIYSGNSTVIFEDDAIFGSDCETGKYIAIDPDTGERLWETFELTSGGKRRASHGTAFTVKSGDRYFIFTETGDLVIASLTREGFETHGRMHVVDATNSWAGRDVVWSHPAFARKCMFARNDEKIVCVSLAKD